MSAPKILAYQLSLPVRWADMDINGHVNNARFFTYYDLLSEADPSIKYADGQAVMVWVDRTTGKAIAYTIRRRYS